MPDPHTHARPTHTCQESRFPSCTWFWLHQLLDPAQHAPARQPPTTQSRKPTEFREACIRSIEVPWLCWHSFSRPRLIFESLATFSLNLCTNRQPAAVLLLHLGTPRKALEGAMKPVAPLIREEQAPSASMAPLADGIVVAGQGRVKQMKCVVAAKSVQIQEGGREIGLTNPPPPPPSCLRQHWPLVALVLAKFGSRFLTSAVAQLATMMTARRSDSDPLEDNGEDTGEVVEVVEVELHGRGSAGTTATGFRYSK